MAETYLWITLASAFGGDRPADAGPFAELGAAMRTGRSLARQAGQLTYSMAEFDGQGRQMTETAAWLALACDIDADPDGPRAASPNDAPEREPVALGAPPPIADGLAEVYSPTADQAEMAATATNRLRAGYRRRRQTRRRQRRARR